LLWVAGALVFAMAPPFIGIDANFPPSSARAEGSAVRVDSLRSSCRPPSCAPMIGAPHSRKRARGVAAGSGFVPDARLSALNRTVGVCVYCVCTTTCNLKSRVL
jgi:hypothetical protein